jgi:DNA-directed RNA polymerase I, II, and III subunit RPABC1
MSSEILHIAETIYRGRNVLLEMLESRGYDTTNYTNYNQDEINIMLNAFSEKTRDSSELGPLDIFVNHKTDGTRTYVKYRLDKFKVSKQLEQTIDDIFKNKLEPKDTLILIMLDRVHFKNPKENRIEEYVNKYFIKTKYFIQFFGLENLLFNISKHELVPKHEIINKDELKRIVADFNIEHLKNFPTIRREDPMAKYIGLRPGQICRITYPSLASCEYTKYRLCTLI